MRRLGMDGGVSRDHIVLVDRGARFHVPGGPGLYACLAAARVCGGSQVRLLQAVPTQAHDIAELLYDARVAFTQADDGVFPRLWILDSPQGRRVLATSPPAGGHELQDDAEVPPATDVPALAADDLTVLLRCAPTTPNPPDLPSAAVVVLDPDQRELARAGMGYLRKLTEGNPSVVCPSRVQLGLLDPDPWRAAELLRADLGVDVVGRLDREGSIVLPRDGGRWRVWAESARVIDTTGAGDSHAGATAAGLLDPAARTTADGLVEVV